MQREGAEWPLLQPSPPSHEFRASARSRDDAESLFLPPPHTFSLPGELLGALGFIALLLHREYNYAPLQSLYLRVCIMKGEVINKYS